MNRRNFFSKLTSGAASAAALQAAVSQPASSTPQRVTWQIKGYTCITCAVGLEVMLRGLKGVTEAKASYPAKNVVIGYDSKQISEDKIREFISTCGFTVSGNGQPK